MLVSARFSIALVGAGALLAVSGAASAESSARWGGAFVGAGIGAIGLSGTERDTHTVPPHTDTLDGDRDWGVLGSIYAGYDFRLAQNVIAGAFAEFDFTNAEFNVHGDDGINSLQENHAFNIGGRVGVLVSDATLLYALGGYSRGRFEFGYADEYSTEKNFGGWFAGAGVEQKITGALGVKLEYRFADYGEEKVGVFISPAPVDEEAHFIDANSHSIRLGASYSFGP